MIAAAGATKDARAGLPGYIVALGVGAALAGGSAWAMWSLGERVAAAVEARPDGRWGPVYGRSTQAQSSLY